MHLLSVIEYKIMRVVAIFLCASTFPNAVHGAAVLENRCLVTGCTRQCFVCENSTLNVSCPENHTTMQIRSSLWGRKDPHSQICPSSQPTTKLPCTQINTTEVLRTSCNSHKFCLLAAPSGVSDPCPNQRKYFEVVFKCRGKPIHGSKSNTCWKEGYLRRCIICESNKLKIRCPKDKVIDVKSSFYGRKVPYSTFCSYRTCRQTSEDTNCVGADPRAKLTLLCQTKPHCIVNVTSYVFGEACPTTRKYIDLTYACTSRRSAQTQQTQQTTSATGKFSATQQTRSVDKLHQTIHLLVEKFDENPRLNLQDIEDFLKNISLQRPLQVGNKSILNYDRANLYISKSLTDQNYYTVTTQLGSAWVKLFLNTDRFTEIVVAMQAFQTNKPKTVPGPKEEPNSLLKTRVISLENTTYIVIVAWQQPNNSKDARDVKWLSGNITYNVQGPSQASKCKAAEKISSPRQKAKSFEPICLFFDPAKESFSDRGCTTTSDGATGRVTCKCDHLTVFTALMTFTAVKIPRGVKITCYITESVSVLFLVLTIIILLAFNREKGRIPIQINFSLSLLFLHVINLVHDFIVMHEKPCETITVMSHFFLLSSGMWFLVEGLRLFMATSNPIEFQAQNTRKRLIVFMLIGWMISAVIVGVATVLGFTQGIYIKPQPLSELCRSFPNLTSVSTPKYDRCWLAPNTHIFYSTVIAPLAVILLINLFIAVKTSHVIFNSTRMRRRAGHRNSSDALRATKTFFFLFIMLGGTWALGFFTGVGNTITNKVFMYIHSVVNGLEGFVVFLLYCVMDSDIRKEVLSFVRPQV